MVWFTVVTGIATLVSLFLQVSGLLGEKRKYLVYSTCFLVGLTLGLLLNIAFSVNVSLPVTTTPKQLLGLLLFSATGLLAFILFILTVVVEDEGRRKAATVGASAVSSFLLFLLVFFLNSFFG